MTEIYYVKRKAEDLKMGDMFIDWAFPRENPPVYGKPNRILSIRNKRDDRNGDYLEIKLDDMRKFKIHPNHVVIVQGIA